jgi:ElaA protein
MPTIGSAPLARIDPAILYRIVRLRTDVFTFEQRIFSEPELDGRDLEPTTVLYWVEDEGEVVATLRVLRDDPVVHIGRVATARQARGRGFAGRLIERACEDFSEPVEISAQAHLEQWYGRFGFVRTGPNYPEVGIDHVPMRRPGR